MDTIAAIAPTILRIGALFWAREDWSKYEIPGVSESTAAVLDPIFVEVAAEVDVDPFETEASEEEADVDKDSVNVDSLSEEG